jgi:hypothetical protein
MRSGRVRTSSRCASSGAAEVIGAEILALHPGTERTVEDEDTLAQCVEEVTVRHFRSALPPSRVDHRYRLRGEGVAASKLLRHATPPATLTIESSSAAADRSRRPPRRSGFADRAW